MKLFNDFIGMKPDWVFLCATNSRNRFSPN
jgi:hypothetical protein